MGAGPGRHASLCALDHDCENRPGEQRGYPMDGDSVGGGRGYKGQRSPVTGKGHGGQRKKLMQGAVIQSI